MTMETHFVAAVTRVRTMQNWTTRRLELHLIPAFENVRLTQANKNLMAGAVSCWQIDFCPYNAHSSLWGCARGLRTGNLWRPLVSLFLETLRGNCGAFYSPDKSEKPAEVAWQSWGRWLISPFACSELKSSGRQSKYNLEFDLWKLDRACPFQDLWESNVNDKVRV